MVQWSNEWTGDLTGRERAAGAVQGQEPGLAHVQAHEDPSLYEAGHLREALGTFSPHPTGHLVPSSAHCVFLCLLCPTASQLPFPLFSDIYPGNYLENSLPKDKFYLLCSAKFLAEAGNPRWFHMLSAVAQLLRNTIVW